MSGYPSIDEKRRTHHTNRASLTTVVIFHQHTNIWVVVTLRILPSNLLRPISTAVIDNDNFPCEIARNELKNIQERMLGLPLHQVGDTLVKHLGKPFFFVVRGNDDGKRQRCIIIQRRERILLSSP